MANKRLTKEQIFTIPNILSYFRILLIPLIIWLYCAKQEYYWAIAVIALSALTDILDGKIARHFNMVSDFGKLVDPIADKLTQAAMIFCLATKHRHILILILLLVVKESLMFTCGYIIFKVKDTVNSAKWYGKANTVILYGVMMVLILLPNISNTVADTLIAVCAASMIISLILYIRYYVKILTTK